MVTFWADLKTAILSKNWRGYFKETFGKKSYEPKSSGVGSDRSANYATTNIVATTNSVPRLGHLLDFGQVFKAFLGNFCKSVKINHFSCEIIFGQLYRQLAIFSGHTDYK